MNIKYYTYKFDRKNNHYTIIDVVGRYLYVYSTLCWIIIMLYIDARRPINIRENKPLIPNSIANLTFAAQNVSVKFEK